MGGTCHQHVMLIIYEAVQGVRKIFLTPFFMRSLLC